MNKSELLENYTAEQLAEMVEKYQKAFDALKFTDSFLEKTGLFSNPMVAAYEANIKVKEKKIQELEEKLKETDKISVIVGGIVKTYSTGEVGDIIRAYEDIKHCKEHGGERLHSEEHLKIISLNREIDKMKCDLKHKQNEMDKLKEQLVHSQTTITQIDEILKDLFGVTFEICETKEDFDGFKSCLEKEYQRKAVSCFLPTEPIKVADMLISAKIEPKEINSDGAMVVHKQMNFYLSELQQIAKHLLVYCNANGEVEE